MKSNESLATMRKTKSRAPVKNRKTFCSKYRNKKKAFADNE